MGVLGRILDSKRAELAALRRRSLPPAPPARPVVLKRGATQPLRLLAEIKLKSPSAGLLSQRLSVAERAAAYAEAGATMLSVLCDGPFFGGDYEHLRLARAACDVPLLCKEFVVDECQLDAARAYGADAVLLIVRCLTPQELARLVAAAQERQLAALVEVATAEEARLAQDCGASVVGVNTRDLDTLQMDAARAAKVLAELPATVTAVHLSGLKSPEDIAPVAHGRADAALIGEALMRQDDPRALLRQMVQAAAH